MAVERVEWQCPQCSRRYAIPADLPRPSLCPKCQDVATEPAATNSPDAPADELPKRFSSSTASVEPPSTQDGDIELPDRDRDFNASRYRRRYPALRVITLFYRLMAGVIVLASVAGFVAGVVGVFQEAEQTARMRAVALGLGSLFGGAFWSVSVLAFAELIQLGLDIEQNTRPR